MEPILEKNYVRPRIVTEPPAPVNGSPKRYRWTASEYYQMADMGFFKGKRVELIRGEIIEMAPMKTPHATAVRLVREALTKVFGKGYLIDSQLPLSLGRADQPEPDVAVVEGDPRDFADAHPTSAKLVVEVSDSTLRFDRMTKAELYAENRIDEYWIVNLKQRCLEVYRRPVKDKNFGFAYTEIFVVREGEAVSPLAKPKKKIKVADILP
ncbi:MAG: Uma2 family endonuclease [Pyrinomonadaceae bacterium]